MEPNHHLPSASWLAPLFFSILLGLSGCSKPELAEPEEEPVTAEPVIEVVRLPVDRVLQDQEGRSIDATIIGREMETITIIRKSDSRRFDYPIAQLSEEDRQFVTELKLHSAPKERPAKTEPEKEDPYVQSRLDQIERLRLKLKDLEEHLKENSTNQIIVRAYHRDVEKINEEILVIQDQISDFRGGRR